MIVLDQTGQSPRIGVWPECVSSAGADAVELAAASGLHLDPWQAMVLEHALGERADGQWAAFEVAMVVPRQNGKGAILEARALTGLFVLGERLIIWSAHQFDTSLEAFRRLLGLIEDTPELDQRVKRVSRSHGEEGVELFGGQRIRFRTRTKGGGRGFSGDCLILDEAMILPEAFHGALLPTVSARPNPQVWYAASAVDQLVHEHGVVLARVRERGLRGGDPSLAYFEWGVDRRDGRPYTPGDVTPDVAADPAAWGEANPAMGIRISAEHIENERSSMDPRTFAVERLGVGDWPATDGSTGSVINIARWRGLVDAASAVHEAVTLAYDVTPDRGSAAICAAGIRADGLMHVEVVDHRPGTGWVAARLAELCERHSPSAVVCDAASPAASLIDAAADGGVRVTVVSTGEYVAACGHLYDLVDQGRLRHLGTAELDVAVKGAARRSLVDAWAWSRRSSRVDISPLVAATLAAWRAALAPEETTSSWRPLS